MSEEKAPYYVTLSYDSAFRGELKKLCDTHGITQKDFVQFAIEYFNRTGIDPREKVDLSSLIKTSENRLIGFLKVQDKNAQLHFNHLQTQLNQALEENQRLASTINNLVNALR